MMLFLALCGPFLLLGGFAAYSFFAKRQEPLSETSLEARRKLAAKLRENPDALSDALKDDTRISAEEFYKNLTNNNNIP